MSCHLPEPPPLHFNLPVPALPALPFGVVLPTYAVALPGLPPLTAPGFGLPGVALPALPFGVVPPSLDIGIELEGLPPLTAPGFGLPGVALPELPFPVEMPDLFCPLGPTEPDPDID